MAPTEKKKTANRESKRRERPSHAGPKEKPRHPTCRSTSAPVYEARRRQSEVKRRIAKNSLRLTLGMTCPNRNCFAVDPFSGAAVYPASGVAVLLDTLSCKQLCYIQASTHSISCVNFSPDGQYILLGEQGHMPALLVWSKALKQQVAKFQGHEFGVGYAAFSRKMDILVSVGTNHDGSIFVWSWPNSERISCNRFAEAIYATSFSDTDSFFVTCGFHHIRFWYPGNENSLCGPDTLLGRSVIMRDNKTRTYVDVACGSERSEKFVYSVTTCGLLCKINSQRQLTQFLMLRKTELTSVQVRDDQLVVGTAFGYVHFFSALSMQYKFTISVPVDKSLTSPNLHDVPDKDVGAKPCGKMYLGLDNVNKQLTAVLENGDLCIWDIKDPGSAHRKFFASGHNKVVSGLDSCLTTTDKDGPREIMFSVAHDGTMRQWKIDVGRHVSCETRKALYTGNYNPRNPATCDTEVITVVKTCQELGLVAIGDSKGVVTVYDAKSLQAIRCIMGHSRGITAIIFYTGSGDNKDIQLMLSGGRDRLINVHDVKKDFQLLNSLCLHSGSISGLAVAEATNSFTLISSALDRNVTMSSTSKKEPYRFTPRQCLSTTASVIDIRVSPASHWAVLGRSNAVLIVIDTQSFQSVRTFRACKDPKATLERLCLDARGALVVTACSDRSINLLSVHHGLRLACLKGHATPVSGLVLTSDMRHVISSSRDGCIFLWEIHRCARRQANSLFKLGVRRAKFEVKKAPNVILSSKSSVELSNKPEISQTPSTASMPKSHSSMDVSG